MSAVVGTIAARCYSSTRYEPDNQPRAVARLHRTATHRAGLMTSLAEIQVNTLAAACAKPHPLG
jgi:hypothetical protein